MAHKTMIDGTAYTIKGGRTLVDGTGYTIKNGKVLVDGTVYDLSFCLPPGLIDLWAGDSTSRNKANRVYYGGGYWVVAGGRYTNSKYCATIAYAKKLNGPWVILDVWEGNDRTMINCIAYANGYWVIGGTHCVDKNRYAKIAYAESPDETWNSKNLWSNSSASAAYDSSVNDIIYADNKWVVCGVGVGSDNQDVPHVGYSSDLTTWRSFTIQSNTRNYVANSIAYGNGYWVVGGRRHTTGSRSIYAILYFSKTLSSGNWSVIDCWGSGYMNNIAKVIYAGGYWVFSGEATTGSTYKARLGYIPADNELSTSTRTTDADIFTGTREGELFDVTYSDGIFAVCGMYSSTKGVYYTCIYYTGDITGSWTKKSMWSSTSTVEVRNIHYSNGYWVAVGNDSSDYTTKISYAKNIEELQ